MADYTIYQLGESDLTISGGQQLDGVSQGDGTHLVGETITFNTSDWTGIDITDNDSAFEDSDTSQTLNGAQVIDGVRFADGTVVEAEYQLTVTDGTDTWTLIGFNANNSSPAYATVEGIAVVGGVGGFPPVGVPLTVTSSSEGPSYAGQTEYATPICFTTGTRIATPQGERTVEALRPGDLVETLTHGAQPVRWVGMRQVAAEGAFAPVLFHAGGPFGNRHDLKVSQRHRMLIADWRSEYYFGCDQVLASALHLVNGRDITLAPGGLVTYVHLLFDDHEVIRAEGAWSESLHPGRVALRMLDGAARAEVLALFPELALDSCPRPLAAQELRRHEARLVA